jgi:DNA-binding XRE family transcriptional regulator
MLSFVSQLRKAREQAGYSQSELARLIKVPQATISALETGKTQNPSHTLVIRICRVLRRKPEDVFPVRLERTA